MSEPTPPTGELLQSAQMLLQANDLPGATDAYTRLSELLPDDPHVWFTLGALKGKLGELETAADCFRRVTRLVPEHPEAYSNLGMALHSQGKLPEAEAAYQQALALQPGRIDILSNLAWLRGQQQRYTEAAELYRQVLAANPGHAAAHSGLGSSLQALDQLDEAENCYRRALEIEPRNPQTLDGLGVVLHKQGRIDEAIDTLEQVVTMVPDFPQARYHLGMALFDKGEFQRARNHIETALRLNPDYLEAHVTLGRVALALGSIDQAIRHYEHAIDLSPECSAAYENLGAALQAHGKYDEAIAAFRTAREIDPDSTEAIAGEASVYEHRGDVESARTLIEHCLDQGKNDISLATVYAAISKKLGTMDRAIQLLKDLLPAQQHAPARRGEIYLALGSIYQTRKEYDTAFQHFITANDLYPYQFDRTTLKQKMESIATVFSAENMARLPRANNHSERPVFIVAMPRSGTTLTEQILAAHPDVHGAGELPFIERITSGMSSRLGLDYPAGISSVSPAAIEQFSFEYLNEIDKLAPPEALRVTDKMPHNFMDLGLIELLFPHARVIHISRDPRDTCVSIFTHHFAASHAYATDLGDLGFYYRQYQRLMDHWRKVLSIPMLDLRYEDIVADPEGEIRRIIAFCGLDWSDECLEFHNARRDVATPSYDQVRQPIYKGSVGRWKHYEKFLSPLIEELNRTP